MTSIVVYVALIGFLSVVMKYSDRNTRWWLWFIILGSLITKLGYEISTITLLCAMGFWKFIKDISNDL